LLRTNHSLRRPFLRLRTECSNPFPTRETNLGQHLRFWAPGSSSPNQNSSQKCRIFTFSSISSEFKVNSDFAYDIKFGVIQNRNPRLLDKKISTQEATSDSIVPYLRLWVLYGFNAVIWWVYSNIAWIWWWSASDNSADEDCSSLRTATLSFYDSSEESHYQHLQIPAATSMAGLLNEFAWKYYFRYALSKGTSFRNVSPSWAPTRLHEESSLCPVRMDLEPPLWDSGSRGYLELHLSVPFGYNFPVIVWISNCLPLLSWTYPTENIRYQPSRGSDTFCSDINWESCWTTANIIDVVDDPLRDNIIDFLTALESPPECISHPDKIVFPFLLQLIGER